MEDPRKKGHSEDAEVEGHKKGFNEDQGDLSLEGEGKKGFTEDDAPEVEGHGILDKAGRAYKKG